MRHIEIDPAVGSIFTKENLLKLLVFLFFAGVAYGKFDAMDTRVKRIENLVDYLAQKQLKP